MCTICPETVDAFGFAPIGRDAPYEVIHHDNLQSVLGLSGHDGTILQTITYDAFGNQLSTTGAANNNELHYTGRELDPDTGLYNYRARLYDPTIGRFVSEDKMGFKAGVNFFVYAGDNPINFNDPYGLARGDWWDPRSYTDSLYWKTVYSDFASGAALNRVGAALKAEVGIAAGAGQMVYAYANTTLTGAAIGAHGIGNYLGGIGDLSNVIYGGDRDWNVTKTGYETASQAVLGNKDYGTTAFYATDLLMAGKMALDPTKVEDTVNIVGTGIDLSRSRIVPAEMTQPAAVVANDVASIVTTANDAWNSATGGDTAAAGGYLIYPNKPNTNMMRSVYAK